MSHETEKIMKEAETLLDEMKALGIETFRGDPSALADWIMIASGEADKHLDAMSEKLRLLFKEKMKVAVEGTGASGWVLIDVGSVVIHLMSEEKRRLYNLEELWAAFKKMRERKGGA